MDKLLTKSAFLVEEVSLAHLRDLHEKIDWKDRLIGVLGARGTGKTTLLLQRLKTQYSGAGTALYVSLDDVYFAGKTLYEMAETFRQQGGNILFLDEVHKYKGWAREIKNIYDTYKDLSIVFTGSSVIDIYQQEADLSRRAVFYELSGLSFREYLHFAEVFPASKYNLSTILKDHTAIALELGKQFRPLQHFGAYLDHGYFPFFTENLNTYPLRLEQIVRLIIETELHFIDGFDIHNTRKILQLLVVLAENVPFKPNVSKLSEKIGISRATLVQYLHYLDKARLINMLEATGRSISILQKPEKIYLENTNLQQTLAPENVNRGTQREAFFINQLRNAGHEVSLPAKGDFMIDRQYTFEIGGKGKTAIQIKGIGDAFVAMDDIEIGARNQIPLWLFGMLY